MSATLDFDGAASACMTAVDVVVAARAAQFIDTAKGRPIAKAVDASLRKLPMSMTKTKVLKRILVYPRNKS